MPSLRMMTRVMGFEVKLVIAVVALAFIAKACSHPGVDPEAIKALGPEPEKIYTEDCDSGYLQIAASSELAVQKGELTKSDQIKVNQYTSEYDRRISRELVKPTMDEADAIYSVVKRCRADQYRYDEYQKKLEELKKRNS